MKRKLIMIKVVCSECGKIRLWESLAEATTHCWECAGEHILTEVEVK